MDFTKPACLNPSANEPPIRPQPLTASFWNVIVLKKSKAGNSAVRTSC